MAIPKTYTPDPTTKTVLFEDLAAVTGGLLAFCRRRAPPGHRREGVRRGELEAIEQALRSHRDIKELLDLRTMYLSRRSSPS